MLFKCPSCGIDLQVPDDRAGRRGRCKSCGSQVTAPAAAIGGTKSDGYVRVCDLLAEQSDLVGGLLGTLLLHPWNECVDRFAELDEQVGEEEDPERIRGYITEAIDSLGRGPAERAIRAGRQAVLEALLESNDETVRGYSAKFVRARHSLSGLRSSPADEAFVDETLPQKTAAIGPALDRLELAHQQCRSVWREMVEDGSWKGVASAVVDGLLKGASRGAVAAATLGWFGVALATAASFLGEDGDTDAGDKWDRAYDDLIEAHGEVSEHLNEWLPSMQRASRYVLRTFYERAMKAVAAADLSADEWEAWLELETQDLAEIKTQYREFTEDDA